MTKTKISKLAIEIFQKSVNDYHIHDDINRKAVNPFEEKVLSIYFMKRIG
jgi:hypothetical protein